MNASADMRVRLSQPPSPPPTLYTAEYILTRASLAGSSVNLDEYPGLLFFHLVRPDQGPPLITTYWNTRDHHRRYGERFRTDTGAGSLTAEGYVEGFVAPPKSIWKRIHLYMLLLGLTTLLGALETIGHHYDWLFGRPYLLFEAPMNSIQLVEGKEFQYDLRIVNRSGVLHRDIELAARLQSPALPPLALQVSPSRIPQIPEGGSEEVSISGVTPIPGVYPEYYKLDLDAKAHAGILRAERNSPFARPVTAWPKRPKGSLAVKSTWPNGLALLSGQLAVGPAAVNGLECEIEIDHVPGIRYTDPFDFPLRDGVAEFRKSDYPGAEVASLVWTVGPVTDFQSLKFQLTLQGQPETDWKQVCRQAKVNCFYRKEAIRHEK